MLFMSSGSKKEPRYECRSEARASHRQTSRLVNEISRQRINEHVSRTFTYHFRKTPYFMKTNFNADNITTKCYVYFIFLGSWFRSSFSTYVYKYPTTCNNGIFFITRLLYMFRALSVPIIRSTLTVIDSHWCNVCYGGS
jgi:hypothetical protein